MEMWLPRMSRSLHFKSSRCKFRKLPENMQDRTDYTLQRHQTFSFSHSWMPVVFHHSTRRAEHMTRGPGENDLWGTHGRFLCFSLCSESLRCILLTFPNTQTLSRILKGCSSCVCVSVGSCDLQRRTDWDGDNAHRGADCHTTDMRTVHNLTVSRWAGWPQLNADTHFPMVHSVGGKLP